MTGGVSRFEMTSTVYRFPLQPTGGAARVEQAQGWASSFWQNTLRWLQGPWLIDSWLGVAVLVGGLMFQIGLVTWFSSTRPRGPEYIHPLYSFWAWVVMSLILTVLSVPYVVWLEPLIGGYIGASVTPMTGRKPLLVALNVVATTVILLVAVLPAVDGNYSDSSPYMYIVAEAAFQIGWLFGILYCIVQAVSNPRYSLAHLGLTPALVAVMFLLAGMAGAGMVKDWMIRCNTGEEGGGPWDGCTGAMDSGGLFGGGGSAGPAPTSECPCPNGAGTRCNCPFADDCSTHDACYNPSDGSIPGKCKHGCTPFG